MHFENGRAVGVPDGTAKLAKEVLAITIYPELSDKIKDFTVEQSCLLSVDVTASGKLIKLKYRPGWHERFLGIADLVGGLDILCRL